MLETYARKGLCDVSVWKASLKFVWSRPYYNEVRVESVEKEDVLNAEHCVEPLRATQLCAVAVGVIVASATRRAADFMPPISLLLIGRSLRQGLDERFMVARKQLIEPPYA